MTEGKKKTEKKESGQRETGTSGNMEEVLGELNTKSESRARRDEYFFSSLRCVLSLSSPLEA